MPNKAKTNAAEPQSSVVLCSKPWGAEKRPICLHNKQAARREKALMRRDFLIAAGALAAAPLGLNWFNLPAAPLFPLRPAALRKRPALGLKGSALFFHSFCFPKSMSEAEVLKAKKALSPIKRKLQVYLKRQILKGRLEALAAKESFRERELVLLFKNQKAWRSFYVESFKEGAALYSHCQSEAAARMRGGRLEIFQRQVYQGAALAAGAERREG